MDAHFSDRIQDVPRSFIREILKVTMNKEMISFAGGLPNRQFFPLKQLEKAAARVFAVRGSDCLQYANSEGLLELRQFIADRYESVQGIAVNPEQILITNGSQQALDLIAKATLNDGDHVIIEEPGYLGAIQALSFYRPSFLPVEVNDDGMELSGLENAIKCNPKMMYTVPNFQNPSGITYSRDVRSKVAGLVSGSDCLLIEDDPYGALRFTGHAVASFHHFLPEQTIMLGSFSKIVVPGFRLGWVAAPEQIMEKLLIAKQASDLHTCNFTQYIILEYLLANDVEKHIDTICTAYGSQCRAMLDAIDREFPAGVECTRPEGGMFLWGRLPDGLSSLELFHRAVKQNVAFVPGDPFYTGNIKTSTFRLNFSCVDEPVITDGIARLAAAIRFLQG